MIAFWDLAIRGFVRHLSENSTMDDVMGLLGTPDHVEPSQKSYPTMMLYGYAEFRFRDKLLTYFGCDLLCDFDQEHGYKVFARMPSEDLRTWEEIKLRLAAENISFRVDKTLSDSSSLQIVTERNVVMAFVNGSLGKIARRFSLGYRIYFNRSSQGGSDAVQASESRRDKRARHLSPYALPPLPTDATDRPV